MRCDHFDNADPNPAYHKLRHHLLPTSMSAHSMYSQLHTCIYMYMEASTIVPMGPVAPLRLDEQKECTRAACSIKS
jgi:hypothetical protein